VQTKKLLGSTLALGMLFPAIAQAELVKGLKFGGQFDLQSTSGRNVTDFATRPQGANANNDRIGDAQTRIMLHADWDLLDDVHAKVTLRKNDRTWGTTGGTAQGPVSKSQALEPTGGTDVLGNIFVDQAYIKIDKVFGAVDATMGRQFWGTSGDMVAYWGPSDKAAYGLWVTAVDALRADWSNDMIGLTGLAGKTVGHAVGVAGVADVDVRNLTASLKGHENMGLSAYVWNQVTHNIGGLGTPASAASAGGKNDNLWVVGAKGKVSMGMAWLTGEFAKNFGENRAQNAADQGPASKSYTGWAGKVDLGAKVETPIGGVAPWAHVGYGSGDGSPNDGNNSAFTAISPDYRPGSIYGRFAVAPTAGAATLASGVTGAGVASNSLSNRAIWGVGIKTTPTAMNKLTAGISYWDYKFAARPGGAATGLKHIGSEADLDLQWAHSENVTLGAGVGQFWSGGYLTALNSAAGQPNNPAQLAYFDVRVKF
jgi:hypothetical protein